MGLPFELAEAAEEVLREIPPARLKECAGQLSDVYRDGGPLPSRSVITAEHAAAYAAVRMPATYAAVLEVLSRLPADRVPRISSLLDLGGGTGAGAWAAAEVLSNLDHITLVEREKTFSSLGQTLMNAAGSQPLCDASWVGADLLAASEFTSADVVLLSYVLTEIPDAARKSLVERAWNASAEALVIVLPGTPRAFEVLLAVRRQLLALGAAIIAPCPHALRCPMAETPSWCHFAVRVERSRRHRLAKGGDLGYEDEKFCYLIAGRDAASHTDARIVNSPKVTKAYIELDLCTSAGEWIQTSIPRRDGALFKRAKKARWGDPWNTGG